MTYSVVEELNIKREKRLSLGMLVYICSTVTNCRVRVLYREEQRSRDQKIIMFHSFSEKYVQL